MFERLQSILVRYLWFALIVMLPVTSMPLIISLLGSDSVAAPSGIFLLLFILVWLIPNIIKGLQLPTQFIPIIFFAMVAFFSITLSPFREILPYKDLTTYRSEVTAGITLLVGLCFYFVASLWPAREGRLTWTIQLLNWSGMAVIVWSLIQAIAWYSTYHYPIWLRMINGFFSIGPLNRQRVMGFTLEPSWLAHQLNILYLPLWLAATSKRYSAHKFRALGFSFENLLLAGGICVLVLTLSRIGYLAFLMMLAYLVYLATNWFSNWVSHKTVKRSQILKTLFEGREKLLSSLFFVLLLVSYVGLLLGAGLILSRMDIRTAKLFDINFNREEPLFYYAGQINIAARLVYWQAGWNIFNEYPWLGVGLGNVGFFIPSRLSDYALGLVEVRQLLYQSTTLLNIKCLWIRILAETGIIGFTFYLYWFFLQFLIGRSLEKNPSPLAKTLGLMGILTCLSMILEGFSVDSFALPYIWIVFGLMTSSYLMVGQRPAKAEFKST